MNWKTRSKPLEMNYAEGFRTRSKPIERDYIISNEARAAENKEQTARKD